MGARIFKSSIPDMKFQLCFVFLIGFLLLVFSWQYLSVNVRFLTSKSVIILLEEKGDPSLPPAETTKAPTVQTRFSTTNMSTLPTPSETPIAILRKDSFKKMPVWDFEEVYHQDSPPLPSICPQSLRNSSDKEFRKVFLPNIRLYMHKGNFNMKEWNRLSHFNSPFGFMDYAYKNVRAAAKLIPTPTEPLLVPKPGGDGCIRCAVVGTSGILNGSRMGQEIDAHDYVFRVNGAITKGYEKDVGSRTSVYVHSAHSITASLLLLRKYGYKGAPRDKGIKYVMIPEGMRDFQWLEGLLKGERIDHGPYNRKVPRNYYSPQFNESHFYVLHQDFLRYVKNSFLKSRNLQRSFWRMVRPTNGAFTVFLALHTCDMVDVYGYMTDDYKKYSNYYVHRLKTKVIFYSNHDYHLEKNVWKKLHNSKIINLYQRKESES